MTTNVTIVVPKPNHKRVKVVILDKTPEGTWLEVGSMATIAEHGTNVGQYLTDSRRIMLEEVD